MLRSVFRHLGSLCSNRRTRTCINFISQSIQLNGSWKRYIYIYICRVYLFFAVVIFFFFYSFLYSCAKKRKNRTEREILECPWSTLFSSFFSIKVDCIWHGDGVYSLYSTNTETSVFGTYRISHLEKS